MIEAVNSVLSNSPVIRGNAEAVDSARSFAVNPDRVQEIAVPQAPFVSPYVSVDVDFDTAVLQIRDSETGDVLKQFPSETRLQERSRLAKAEQNAQLFKNSGAEESSSVRRETTVVASESTLASPGGVGGVAEAQIASQALAASAQTGSRALSAGVNVAA